MKTTSSVLKDIFKSPNTDNLYRTLRESFPVEYQQAMRELESQHEAVEADPNDIHNGVIATVAPAHPDIAQMVIDAPLHTGRSVWLWIRLANGDLVLGCYPKAETYEATEVDPGRP